MACKPINLGGGVTGIICSRGRRPITCECGARGNKLCDYPLGKGRTCDKPLCDKHAFSRGHELDYCPTHHKMMEADDAKTKG